MLTQILPMILILILLLATPATAGTSLRINPYAPTNAVAAEAPTPYNLDQLPKCSRVYYQPCPTCGPPANLLPDLPPVWERFPGPLYMPVPVP